MLIVSDCRVVKQPSKKKKKKKEKKKEEVFWYDAKLHLIVRIPSRDGLLTNTTTSNQIG